MREGGRRGNIWKREEEIEWERKEDQIVDGEGRKG